jgi:hypothetical protein
MLWGNWPLPLAPSLAPSPARHPPRRRSVAVFPLAQTVQ